jgi:hypothetical protein
LDVTTTTPYYARHALTSGRRRQRREPEEEGKRTRRREDGDRRGQRDSGLPPLSHSMVVWGWTRMHVRMGGKGERVTKSKARKAHARLPAARVE